MAVVTRPAAHLVTTQTGTTLVTNQHPPSSQRGESDIYWSEFTRKKPEDQRLQPRELWVA